MGPQLLFKGPVTRYVSLGNPCALSLTNKAAVGGIETLTSYSWCQHQWCRCAYQAFQTVPEVDMGLHLVALSHTGHYLYGGRGLCWLIVALIYFENVHGLEL